MVRSQATSIANIGEAKSEMMIPMDTVDKSAQMRWSVSSTEIATAAPVIEAVRACDDDTATPRHQVKNANCSPSAIPLVVIDKPVFTEGSSYTNSAAKNWMVPTPMIALTSRMMAVIATALAGVSAPAAMGRATAFGVWRPATTKLNAAVRVKTVVSRIKVLTRNHAPKSVQAAYKILG